MNDCTHKGAPCAKMILLNMIDNILYCACASLCHIRATFVIYTTRCFKMCIVICRQCCIQVSQFGFCVCRYALFVCERCHMPLHHAPQVELHGDTLPYDILFCLEGNRATKIHKILKLVGWYNFPPNMTPGFKDVWCFCWLVWSHFNWKLQ